MALINPPQASRPSRMRRNAGQGIGGGGGAPGGLVATAPAAGGGGGGNPHLNSMRQQQRQQRRQQRHRNRGGNGPTAAPPAVDDGGGNDITNTGPGSDAFNAVEHAVPAGMGVLAGVGLDPAAAGNVGQNAWLNAAGNEDIMDTPVHAMGNQGKTRRNRRQRNNNRGGDAGKNAPAPPEPIPGTEGVPDAANMSSYFRNLWYRGNPEDRGYFGANFVGPGRVIPG
jgi:hypothetical protein